MHKVTIEVYAPRLWLDATTRVDEIRQWCRTSLGRGSINRKVIWRTTLRSRATFEPYKITYYVTAYFKNPEHATLFTLAWSR
jgi:hypothetical protein